MRIRGQIGDWPVDLTIELAPEEWAQLGEQVEVPCSGLSHGSDAKPWRPATIGCGNGPPRVRCCAWRADERAGVAGPAGRAGGRAAAGKRLLVRLRHSSEVKVESGVDAPVYHWVG
nr:hypothetical protein [Pseudomonas peli]